MSRHLVSPYFSDFINFSFFYPSFSLLLAIFLLKFRLNSSRTKLNVAKKRTNPLNTG